MRASRVSAEEQYQLIMQCRKSSLSDHQWCLNHDIKPGTFYNWVKRLRQKGCPVLPEDTGQTDLKSIPQEVVRIQMEQPTVSQQASNPMELSVGNVQLRIPNGTDPMLLAQTIKILSEFTC